MPPTTVAGSKNFATVTDVASDGATTGNVEVGVDELDISKLSTVLNAKYGSIHAAQQKLGTAEEIQNTFIDFQKHLYEKSASTG